jgi:hypothetical protein
MHDIRAVVERLNETAQVQTLKNSTMLHCTML